MNRPTTVFAQALVDLGNVALVHHAPEPLNLFRLADTVHVHVHFDDLPAWRSALSGDPIDTESQERGGTVRVSSKATLRHGCAVQVYAYTSDD